MTDNIDFIKSLQEQGAFFRRSMFIWGALSIFLIIMTIITLLFSQSFFYFLYGIFRFFNQGVIAIIEPIFLNIFLIVITLFSLKTYNNSRKHYIETTNRLELAQLLHLVKNDHDAFNEIKEKVYFELISKITRSLENGNVKSDNK